MHAVSTANMENILARRSSRLTVAGTASAPAHPISFDSGHAFPGLPDLTLKQRLRCKSIVLKLCNMLPVQAFSTYANGLWITCEGMASAKPPVEEVLVTNGAKHALELVCRLLLDEGDAIIVPAPPTSQPFRFSKVSVSNLSKSVRISKVSM